MEFLAKSLSLRLGNYRVRVKNKSLMVGSYFSIDSIPDSTEGKHLVIECLRQFKLLENKDR
jgi:hypothetical protein